MDDRAHCGCNKLPIGRDHDAVWSIDVYQPVAAIDLMIDASTARTKTHKRDLVGRFWSDVKPIVFVRFELSPRDAEQQAIRITLSTSVRLNSEFSFLRR